MGIWHDERGDAVEFTAAQCLADEQILKRFEAVETNVSRGIAVKGTDEVQSVLARLKDVPLKRAAHWRRELVRIGALGAPKSEDKKPEDEKPEDKKPADTPNDKK